MNSTGQHNDQVLLIAICVFGAVITVIWWLIQTKEHHMLDKVKNYLRENDEAYRKCREMYNQFFMKFSIN